MVLFIFGIFSFPYVYTFFKILRIVRKNKETLYILTKFFNYVHLLEENFGRFNLLDASVCK